MLEKARLKSESIKLGIGRLAQARQFLQSLAQVPYQVRLKLGFKISGDFLSDRSNCC